MAFGPGPYSNLDRPPLSATALTKALTRGGGRWEEVIVVDRTGSTNADLVALISGGERREVVLVAEEQTAGRGRLDRVWSSPARAGLTFSVAIRPPWPLAQWGWVSLAAGVALAQVAADSGVEDAWVKWPNDLVIGDRKCAGILAEAVGGEWVVIGIGLNVSTTRAELPEPREGQHLPTSLLLEGAATVDRGSLLLALLRQLDHLLRDDLENVRARLIEVCSTMGSKVRVDLPGGSMVVGVATDIDHDGLLVVETDGGRRTFAAGDVRHLRRAQ